MCGSEVGVWVWVRGSQEPTLPLHLWTESHAPMNPLPSLVHSMVGNIFKWGHGTSLKFYLWLEKYPTIITCMFKHHEDQDGRHIVMVNVSIRWHTQSGLGIFFTCAKNALAVWWGRGRKAPFTNQNASVLLLNDTLLSVYRIKRATMRISCMCNISNLRKARDRLKITANNRKERLRDYSPNKSGGTIKSRKRV